jgi:hypothetical protein
MESRSLRSPLVRALVAVGVLVAAVIAFVTLSSGGATSRAEFSVRPSDGISVADLCTSAQLRLSPRPAAASIENSYTEFILVNVSARACDVGGVPTVRLTDDAGVTLEALKTFPAMQATLAALAPNEAVSIAPRDSASVLVWEGGCNGAWTAGKMDTSTRWTVAFSGGPTVTLEMGAQLINCPRNTIAVSAVQRGFATRLPGYVGYVPPSSLSVGSG